jgi:hypothetical protein
MQHMNKILKHWFSVCILAAFCAVGTYSQDNTPYPEGYLNELTKVDMSQAPDVFVTKNGERTVTTVVDGRRWNRAWYWEEVRKKAPQMFDKSNNYAIDRGFSPVANQKFIEHNPQFIKFKGEKLHHHHFKQGNIAYALPEKLHIGKGYTKSLSRIPSIGYKRQILFHTSPTLRVRGKLLNFSPDCPHPTAKFASSETIFARFRSIMKI